jgi:putative nucleotidyltransferase with HDIG domain
MSKPHGSKVSPIQVLVVDDEADVRELVQTILTRAGHQADTAGDALEAQEILATKSYDVIISDILMPKLSGLDLLQNLQRTAPDLPVILITGYPSIDTAAAAVRTASAVDYLSKPISPAQIVSTVERAAESKRMRDENRRLTAENEAYRQRLEGVIQEQSKELVKAYGDLRVSYDFTLEALVAMLDARERATGRHSLRVRDLALILGRELGFSEAALGDLARGTLLHDIGKIATPDAILLKPGKLTEEEWVIMKMHVKTGHDIVCSSEHLEPAAQLILQHHEKFDGSGYPNGIAGKEICLGARIFALVDAYDAMRSVRPYKDSVPKAAAIAEIQRCNGAHFDPELVDVFLSVIEEIECAAGWET